MAEDDQVPYQLIINGEPLESDYPPIVENDAVYVPMWRVLAKLQTPVQKVGVGFYQIKLPDRIVMFNPRGNVVIRYAFTTENLTGKDTSYRSRMQVPVITKNDVIYIPVLLLQKYLDSNVVWGEDNTITVTGKEL